MTIKQRKALAVAGSDERADAVSAMGVWLLERQAQFPQFQIRQWECDEHSVPTIRQIMGLWIGRSQSDAEWEAVSVTIEHFLSTPKTVNQRLAESNARLLTKKTGQLHSTMRLPRRDAGFLINLETFEPARTSQRNAHRVESKNHERHNHQSTQARFGGQ